METEKERKGYNHSDERNDDYKRKKTKGGDSSDEKKKKRKGWNCNDEKGKKKLQRKKGVYCSIGGKDEKEKKERMLLQLLKKE